MELEIEDEIAKLKARFKTLMHEMRKSEPEIMKMFGRDILALLDGEDCESILINIQRKKLPLKKR